MEKIKITNRNTLKERVVKIEEINGYTKLVSLDGKVFCIKIDTEGNILYTRTYHGGIKGRDGITRRTTKHIKYIQYKEDIKK